jgi:hypothetical protein
MSLASGYRWMVGSFEEARALPLGPTRDYRSLGLNLLEMQGHEILAGELEGQSL